MYSSLLLPLRIRAPVFPAVPRRGNCLHAGKVAHYFGWTGPALTVDTACSSSAVAIHTACRDLLAGDCNAALAGGFNVITDPLAFQDLAAAGFLSPTGQCKSFDDRADGYCRGEAVGFVFLKRLSDAVADGNQILGCIASSTIYQNENSTPIFVPNSPSLSGLFKDVMRKAQVQPSDISVVEAHGTGTPVGDPAEWESVRQALESPERADPVYIGSAKGHVGHTEAASGVVALIKVLTMIQGGHIPPQASHSRLNHLIQPSDMMQVATGQRPWQPARKVVLLNNYGASGSNVAMIVTEPPSRRPWAAPTTALEKVALPFCVAGRTVKSLKADCARILSYLDHNSEVKLTDLSFNMHRKFSRHLQYRVAFKCSSSDDLRRKLYQVVTASPGPGAGMEITDVQPDRSVILCFGGQVSTAIGLDRGLYDRTQILRHYLDECDAAIRSFGLRSIYPDIFSQQPVQDQQHLQTMLFAMQYSCAMCWMKSGLSSRVVALVGHSFGELTAMCISSVLSLHDAVKLVAGRARLIRDLWGSDPGVMLAVEADEETHKIFVSYIYDFLEKTVGLVTAEDNGKRKRTGTPIPTASSQSILNELVDKYPAHEDFLRLTFHAGSHLAQGLKGETDGNRVMMSNPEGRRLCQAVYHNYVVNRIGFETMRDVLKRLTGRMRVDEKGPLRVLELGGGTGSATSQLLPLLASLDVPVEYTFTDLSSSLVAQARRTLGKQYPFMRFAVQDIEKPVGKELAGQQHLVVMSHCVHATRSLAESTRNIRLALRPDGFLMMLEMREAWPSLDLSFGLYEGWWLFEDGRTHAYTSHEAWKCSLTAAGYGAVDWTDGALPEHKYYMVVIALASAIRE